MSSNDTETGGREAYYAAAQSWADERVVAEARTRKLAWTVAAVAGATALLLALALVLLVPLKRTEPYVVTVDRQTGAVQVASTLQNGKLTENEVSSRPSSPTTSARARPSTPPIWRAVTGASRSIHPATCVALMLR